MPSERVLFFANGVVFAGCLTSLFQDAIGMEAYLNWVRNGHWVSWTISVPIAILGLMVSVSPFFGVKKK